MTMKDFLNKVSNQKLAKAVIKQLGGWEEFKLSAPDIANNSIDGGFHGFIYYNDTVAFAKSNLGSIIDLAAEQASELGQTDDEMIYSFGCMKGVPRGALLKTVMGVKSEDYDTIMNCLAWYAGEEVCRWYNDLTEDI